MTDRFQWVRGGTDHIASPGIMSNPGNTALTVVFAPWTLVTTIWDIHFHIAVTSFTAMTPAPVGGWWTDARINAGLFLVVDTTGTTAPPTALGGEGDDNWIAWGMFTPHFDYQDKDNFRQVIRWDLADGNRIISKAKRSVSIPEGIGTLYVCWQWEDPLDWFNHPVSTSGYQSAVGMHTSVQSVYDTHGV